MKIKKSVLEKVVREALYREVGKRAINEGKLNEFFGLFGGGKKKKKAAAPAAAEPAAEEPASSEGGYTQNQKDAIEEINHNMRLWFGNRLEKDYYLGPCSSAPGQFGHVPGLETGKRTKVMDKRYDKHKANNPEEWTKENITRWQTASC